MDSQTYSEFQKKYPLQARKKFWKKMVGQIVGVAVIGLFVGTFMGGVISFVVMNDVIKDFNLFSFLLISITCYLLFMAVCIVPYALYVKAYIRRYYYSGEQNFVTIKKGVFAPAEIHVQYQKIQDVYVDQDIWDRIWGLYDVHIASATRTSGIKAHIDGVDQATAEGLKNFFLSAIQNGNSGQSVSGVVQNVQGVASNIPPRNQAVQFQEEISSDKYPLSSKWMFGEIITKVFQAFFSIAIIFFVLSIQMSDRKTSSDFLFLFYGAFILIPLLWGFVTPFLWRKNYSFKFSPEFIYYKTGIISIEEKHMPYGTIQNVNVKQGVMDRILGISKVMIENAAAAQTITDNQGRITAVFSGVILQGLSLADANHITELLKGVVFSKTGSASPTGL
ncbi:MAG: hypothetical protein EXS46_03270 [Candidatus Taylorbacteria bacterium]|nr:hypothetical protein [Candidatus Taylorbacteria bacterium]